MKKRLLKLSLALVSLAIAFGAAEWIYRGVRSGETKSPPIYYRDASGEPLDLGSVVDLAKIFYYLDGSAGLPPGEKPVPVPPGQRHAKPHAWLPGAHFFICYPDRTQPYFDENGCVEYRFNSVGIREEDDLTFAPKPDGQYRVLCQGDSFTLGWGVRAEDNWTTRVEKTLQKTHPALRTVNTGMAGQSYADEYWFALRDRLHRLQPDMVIVSLCLNDLIITNGKLGQIQRAALPDELVPASDRSWWQNSAILRDLARGMAGDPYALDPDHDYVQELLGLPEDHLWYQAKSEGAELFWAAGTPQNSLRAMRDWCKERNLPFGVVIWPFFQGLLQGDTYPFEKLHQLVGEFCAIEEIPALDLLPAFRGHDPKSLWVHPIDMHGNALAMSVASPSIASFVKVLGDL